MKIKKIALGLLATLPTNRDLLFWSQPQRDAAFRALDRIPMVTQSRVVAAGGTGSPLPPGPPLRLPMNIDAYMAGQRSAALIVMHDGKVRLERYETKTTPTRTPTSRASTTTSQRRASMHS